MKATPSPIREAVQALIESRPGIARREITKYLQRIGHRIESKALSAHLRRMRADGTISQTGSPMSFIYWPKGQDAVVETTKDDLEVTRILRPAAPSDFNYPKHASPLQWSMAHLLGA